MWGLRLLIWDFLLFKFINLVINFSQHRFSCITQILCSISFLYSSLHFKIFSLRTPHSHVECLQVLWPLWHMVCLPGNFVSTFLKTFLLSFCYWFLDWLGVREYMLLNFWDLFYSLGYGLFWYMLLRHWKTTCILLLSGVLYNG